MTSKITFSGLTNSMSLEIKMSNILSFYEDLAGFIAFKSDPTCLEIISIEKDTATTRNHSTFIKNVLNFTKPLQRSNDIVNYLIEREQLETVKLSVNI
jgi:hypothetical protein